jgi:hypothetical protein
MVHIRTKGIELLGSIYRPYKVKRELNSLPLQKGGEEETKEFNWSPPVAKLLWGEEPKDLWPSS